MLVRDESTAAEVVQDCFLTLIGRQPPRERDAALRRTLVRVAYAFLRPRAGHGVRWGIPHRTPGQSAARPQRPAKAPSHMTCPVNVSLSGGYPDGRTRRRGQEPAEPPQVRGISVGFRQYYRDPFIGVPGPLGLLQRPPGTGDRRQHPPLPPGRLDPLADGHPPIAPAAFRKVDAVAVLTARSLPAPRHGSRRPAAVHTTGQILRWIRYLAKRSVSWPEVSHAMPFLASIARSG